MPPVPGPGSGGPSSHLRTMYLRGRIDDREIQLKPGNKIHFSKSAVAGHEGVSACAGLISGPAMTGSILTTVTGAVPGDGSRRSKCCCMRWGLRDDPNSEADRCLALGEPSAEHFCAGLRRPECNIRGPPACPSVALFPEIPRAAEQARLSTQGRMHPPVRRDRLRFRRRRFHQRGRIFRGAEYSLFEVACPC